jgi:fructosamine-3-kinase
MNLQALCAAIRADTGVCLDAHTARPVGGGCINRCFRIEAEGLSWFLKTNDAARLTMFAAERAGLEALAAAGALRVPEPVAHGVAHTTAYLLLEWLDLAGRSRSAETALGEGLARLHRHTARGYGFAADNFIGSTPQPNTWAGDWVEFFAERRLGFQLELARMAGYRGRLQARGRALIGSLPAFFEGHAPVPALLHGDLWGGNWACDGDGRPVIFDPAVYYGDRETDLAMTRLFGGFGAGFYAAYEASWPLEPGAGARLELYQLYHVLNHLNLFGGGYLGQAEGMIERLLRAAV